MDLLHHLGYAALELGIVAVEDGFDVVLDHDIGIDAVPFDDPFSFQGDGARLGHEDLAAGDHPRGYPGLADPALIEF